MKTDPLPYKLMSDSEYSVIKSDFMKSFDSICVSCGDMAPSD